MIDYILLVRFEHVRFELVRFELVTCRLFAASFLFLGDFIAFNEVAIEASFTLLNAGVSWWICAILELLRLFSFSTKLHKFFLGSNYHRR